MKRLYLEDQVSKRLHGHCASKMLHLKTDFFRSLNARNRPNFYSRTKATRRELELDGAKQSEKGRMDKKAVISLDDLNTFVTRIRAGWTANQVS